MIGAQALVDLPFPAATRPLVERLAAEPLVDPSVLREDVRAYQSAITDEATRNVLLDASLALDIGDGCLELLDLAAAGAPPDLQRLVQVAVRYFVLDDDGDADMASFLGFEDDAQVFNIVARFLGREDLIVHV